MKNKIIYGIIALVIVLGLVLFFVHGFNIGTMGSAFTRIEVYFENGTDNAKLKEVADKTFDKVIIQDVEYFNEATAVTVKSASEEELNAFVTNINEAFGTEYSVNDGNVTVYNVPAKDFSNVIMPYLIPALITFAICVVYFMIRFNKLSAVKMLLKTFLSIVSLEIFVLSIYVIFNISIDLSLAPFMILAFAVALIYISLDSENKLKEIKLK